MILKSILTFLTVLSLATSARSQTKVSGTAQCAKPDPRYAIEVGDRPNHSFIISHGGCTWTSPLEIAGTKSKDHSGTVFQDLMGNRARIQGSGVDTMENGDKFYVGWRGSGSVKEGMPPADEGTWTFTGGNGKLKGIKGKGTYKCTGAADGTATCEIAGEYELPSK
jgi:hypothetical protein